MKIYFLQKNTVRKIVYFQADNFKKLKISVDDSMSLELDLIRNGFSSLNKDNINL